MKKRDTDNQQNIIQELLRIEKNKSNRQNFLDDYDNETKKQIIINSMTEEIISSWFCTSDKMDDYDDNDLDLMEQQLKPKVENFIDSLKNKSKSLTYFELLYAVCDYFEKPISLTPTTIKAVLDLSRNYAMSNNFVMALYNKPISLVGQKLLRIAIAECDSLKDDKFYCVKYSEKDLAERLGIKQNNIHRDLLKAIDSLAGLEIWIDENNQRFHRRISVFDIREYKNGYIYLRFGASMSCLFLKLLKGNFSQFPLSNIIGMKYEYSMRIYELIIKELKGRKVYADQKQVVNLSIEDIRTVANVGNKYSTIKDLKRRVIIPALEDIEQNANIHCEFDNIKTGRKITGLKITLESCSNLHRKRVIHKI